MRRTYIVIHDETVDVITAFCPDFPGVTVPGDRLNDTLTMFPIILQQHVDKMIRRGEGLPPPTAPGLWDVHAKHPGAIISFVEISTGED